MLRRYYHPELMAGLNLLEALARSPYHLAQVGRAAGGGALTQFGRILASTCRQERSRESRTSKRRPEAPPKLY